MKIKTPVRFVFNGGYTLIGVSRAIICKAYGETHADANITAQEIANALNSHDALVAACQKAAALDADHYRSPLTPAKIALLEAIQAAKDALAKGQSK